MTTFKPSLLYLSTAFSALLCILAHDASAQGSAELHYGEHHARYAGGMVTIEFRDECGGGCWAGTKTARVADLDVDGAVIEEGSYNSFSLWIACKNGSMCESHRGRWVGLTMEGTGSPNGENSGVAIECNTRSECERFLDTLKASTRSSPPEPQQESLSEKRSLPEKGRTEPSGATNNPFNDIAGGITWRNGGTRTLDDLARKSTPEQNAPRQANPHATYAAFAQSGGFDANGGWGAATGTNLNGTMAAANTACAKNSDTMCGDEGYCVLRPGMWGAWASDLKPVGAKGFVCNQTSKEAAEATALAWCGRAGCKVLWSGAGE